ncbi:MAG: hypothetical protein ACJARG_001507 [Arcticibacterium sp.]|jgi:hypothetical protein
MKTKLLILSTLYSFKSIGQEHTAHVPLFMSDDTLFISIKTDMKSLWKSRIGKAKDHDGLLTLKEDNSNIKIKLRVRGNFRRSRENLSSWSVSE